MRKTEICYNKIVALNKELETSTDVALIFGLLSMKRLLLKLFIAHKGDLITRDSILETIELMPCP